MSRDRTLSVVVFARFVSLLGTNMTVVALPWFVLATTGSTARMGIVLACQTLPAFVLGIPGGTAVARLGSRRSLVLCDALRAPLLASVPALHAAGVLSFALLLVLVTLIGVFSVPYATASTSLLPEIVGEDEREVARAVSALQVAIQTTGIVGPVVAGVLIAVVGAPQLLYLDSASYAVSALMILALVRAGYAPKRGGRQPGVLVGVSRILRDSLLLSIVAVALVAHVGLAGLFASLPALGFRVYDDARSAGVLFTADALGSVLGGLVALRLARRIAPLSLGVAGFACMAAPLWFLTVETPLPLVVAVMFVFGLGGPLGVAPISAILTTRAPGDIRPQVVAAFLAVTSAGTPAGAAGAGYAIQLIGFRATYVGIAVAMTAAFALLVWCVRRVRSAPDAVPAAAPTL